MNPNPPALIHIPSHWADEDTLTFEDCCRIPHVPQGTARDWPRQCVGPRWVKLEGSGRPYITVAELRRLLTQAANPKGTDR